MTKYYYRLDHNYDDEDLEHFDLPKINLPKIDLPKIDLPFQNKKKGKVTSKKNQSGFKLPSIDDIFGKNENKKSKDASMSNKKGSKGGKKDREWKNHKWVDRKRGPNGKWIYDYGNGFPGEEKDGSSIDFPIDPNDKSFEKNDLSPLGKVAHWLSKGIDAVFGAGDNLESAKTFIGGIKEAALTAANEIRQAGDKVDEKTGLPLKSQETSKEDDMKMVNPGFDNNDGTSQTNCPCCSIAYELRRRGYDVYAEETASGALPDQYFNAFKDPDPKVITTNDMYSSSYSPEYPNDYLTKSAYEEFKKEPDGSRGILRVSWLPDGAGGHVMNYEIENGVPYIYDGQPGQKKPLAAVTSLACYSAFMRTDNKDIDYNYAKEFVR